MLEKTSWTVDLEACIAAFLFLLVIYYEIRGHFVRKLLRRKKHLNNIYQSRCREFIDRWINVCRIYTDAKFKDDKTVNASALFHHWVNKLPSLEELKSEYHHSLSFFLHLSIKDIQELKKYVPNDLLIK